MRFWDASGVVPLLLDEVSSSAMRAEYRRDPAMVVWWATSTEVVSAIMRVEREGRLDRSRVADALAAIDELALTWQEVAPVDRVRQVANRLLRVHPLRAADALQLAAALLAAEDSPATLPIVTLDDRLTDAAQREGFPVVTAR